VRSTIISALGLGLSSTLALTPAYAQSYQCRAPSGLSAPAERKPSSEPRRVKPVTGYTLALSWSPEFCRTRKDSPRDRTQCSGEDGSFAFILHGLWPETNGPAYPQWCASTKPLPPAIVKRNFCMMPTTKMMAHEWAKHGICMTRRPETYFRVSRIMFDAVRFPDMDRLSRKPLTAAQFRNAFAAANDGLMPDMLRLKVNERGWLQEVKLCLGQSFRPQRCPAYMRTEPADSPVKIWRGG
jgi:ribonuclease T2